MKDFRDYLFLAMLAFCTFSGVFYLFTHDHKSNSYRISCENYYGDYPCDIANENHELKKYLPFGDFEILSNKQVQTLKSSCLNNTSLANFELSFQQCSSVLFYLPSDDDVITAMRISFEHLKDYKFEKIERWNLCQLYYGYFACWDIVNFNNLDVFPTSTFNFRTADEIEELKENCIYQNNNKQFDQAARSCAEYLYYDSDELVSKIFQFAIEQISN